MGPDWHPLTPQRVGIDRHGELCDRCQPPYNLNPHHEQTNLAKGRQNGHQP